MVKDGMLMVVLAPKNLYLPLGNIVREPDVYYILRCFVFFACFFFVCSFVCLFVSLLVCLLVCLFVCLSVCLFVCWFVGLFGIASPECGCPGLPKL